MAFHVDRNDGEPWVARALPPVGRTASRATPRSCDSWIRRAERRAVDGQSEMLDDSRTLSGYQI
jgi:hypothetical protein